MKTLEPPHRQDCARWSNRFLILSLLGIAFLTLFPFRFNFAPTLIFHRYPFLLDTSVKPPFFMDFFLNVLLFVPFGFGLTARMRRRIRSGWIPLLLALAAGAGVSYTVEVLQFYIPARDSGWQDVISNSSGSLAGFFLFEFCGAALLEALSRWEDSFVGWLSPVRVSLLLTAYFAASFGISVHLQKESRLSNWDSESILTVGNDASGRSPWNGKVFLLQIWNRTLPEQTIRGITGREPAGDSVAGLLGSYDFTGLSPYQDQENFLPPLAWTPRAPQMTVAGTAELNPKSWLSSGLPVTSLNDAIRKANQFTVHVVCEPTLTPNPSGRILSFSQSADNVNLSLRQEGQFLYFWFRNPLSETRSILAWRVRGAFEPGKVRDIVAAYDGADAFVYLDGNRVPQTYRLSPGASLKHDISFVQTGELQGCVVVYQALVFLPTGVLVGLALGKFSGRKSVLWWILGFGLALPPVLLEILLARVSGGRFWAGDIALALFFGVVGILMIRANGSWEGQSPDSRDEPRQAGVFSSQI
jgi:VanZ family protein